MSLDVLPNRFNLIGDNGMVVMGGQLLPACVVVTQAALKDAQLPQSSPARSATRPRHNRGSDFSHSRLYPRGDAKLVGIGRAWERHGHDRARNGSPVAGVVSIAHAFAEPDPTMFGRP
ncbi:hypothetical protein Rleg4DRAFT_7009 [Rhizobium leguminosarum bv. trifolii WSM2297]|uniref:Uncharacterized protein n=1 Tax=Rhizobium leguminosarum bv. trifolii WSM2297 TaxID=754762 RepID=J0CMQ4_RHILT|nr:hypothetical protein Rleg4DRAFT_5013 [Rhizobium leguminosarum bv. trifolii WSM2297]EJC85142.1 hypothetical protein Rleg4DRAFT_7009 [Rhizobium leguminosarum bv. trifolii WSM2297]